MVSSEGAGETGCWSCDLNNMSVMSLASACVMLTTTALVYCCTTNISVMMALDERDSMDCTVVLFCRVE